MASTLHVCTKMADHAMVVRDAFCAPHPTWLQILDAEEAQHGRTRAEEWYGFYFRRLLDLAEAWQKIL